MIPQLNNIIDILRIIIGVIAFLVLLITLLTCYREFFDVLHFLIVGIWREVKFWLREGWRGIKKLCRKKRRWIHTEDHNDLFI